MAETIKIAGKTLPKNYVYIGGAVVVGVVGYAWWTRGGGTAVEEPEIISPVDEFGDERITPNTLDTFDVAIDTRAGLKTNAEWKQAADAYLAGIGYDSTVVSTALGRFLARQRLNKVDVDIARQAWGSFGEPPENRPWFILEEEADGAAVAPGEVAGLKVVKATPTSVTIGWTATPGSSGYEVRRDGGGTARRDGTTHTSGGLKPNTSYIFRVRSVNNANNFGPEAVLTAKTSAAPPKGSTPGTGTIGFPQNLRVTKATRVSITISWGAVPGAKTYLVTRIGGGRGVPRPSRTHTSSRLRPNTTYQFIVRAVDNAGRSGPSNVITAKTRS